MRILHVDTGPNLRGGQRQLLLLLRGLEEHGHEQSLLARGEMLRAWPGAPVTKSALWKASRKADIVHAHDAHSHTLAVSACIGRPIVVARRVAFPIKTGLLSRWKYRRARKFIAVSEHVHERLVASGIPQDKIAVVYDAINREELATAPAAPRPAGTPLRILTPKIDDPLKRSDIVEEVCKQLGAELILSADLQRDIDQADIFVYISESEGLGSAALLAMAHKKPVIASRVGGLPEVVIDEQTGLLVDNNPDAVAAAVKRMSRDRELTERCVDRAFERLSVHFTDDIMVRRTEEVYRSVLRKPQPIE